MPNRWSAALPLVAVAVTLVLWASAFVAIRHLGHSFSPGALSLGRLLIGSVALGAVLLSRGWTAPTRAEWVRLALIGLLWFGLYNVALNAGERRVDAGTAAMLIQVSPVLVAVLAAVFLRERATVMLGIGLVVAFAGVVLIATSASGSTSHDPVGVLLCLVSAAAYAVSLVLQKPVVARLPAIEVTAVACAVGAVACLPFTGSLVRGVAAASTGDLLWVLYLGVFPTAIAFSTYAYALSSMTAGNLSVTTYLVPPITVLLSWAFLSEVPPAMAYVGGALCLVGVALSRRRPRARLPDGAAAGTAGTVAEAGQ
ncbi:MAG TPA: DMT family transporter [Nocardioidaceae bacterium]|nr:DMT family transporter [Nocardioidaceae bacterium]